ncbi:MAG TPA: class I SAM-dependent methyltransferase [Kofleriaceae bacterium]|nr:class I SAM-dependent methyltransferase [Kofleriaceae bacterium]
MPSALTDQHYWNAVWTYVGDQPSNAPQEDDPRDRYRAQLFERFRTHLAPGRRFLEIGAGGSPWPALLAARFGADAWGIDFSAGGLELAAAHAARERVKTTLVEGDFFDETLLPAGTFDVVYSGGFVEHFPEAQPLMRRIAQLLAPGGVVITAVPNLAGLNGLAQRLVDEDCYRRHIVFTPRSLDAAHALGGLHPVEQTRFVGVADLGWVNFSRVAPKIPAPALKLVWAGITQSRRAAELFAGAFGVRHGGALFSPSLIGVYDRGS